MSKNVPKQRRRWQFANAVLDEARMTLLVNDQPVRLEGKPLAVLRMLLEQPGDVLTKDALLDAVWPDVTVVEASLATAIRKLRVALDDNARDAPIIETVPRIGYRLCVPVHVEESCEPAAVPRPAPHRSASWRWGAVLAAVSAMVVLAAITLGMRHQWHGIAGAGAPQAEAVAAIRALDVDRIHAMLRSGWNPNRSFDNEGNAALSIVIQVCQWNPQHDRQALLLAVRALLDGRAQLDQRNKWGDTPYSIAASPRYCGPDHPVTRMLRHFCYESPDAPGDNCLARYPKRRKAAVS